jgi:hypothetical protein
MRAIFAILLLLAIFNAFPRCVAQQPAPQQNGPGPAAASKPGEALVDRVAATIDAHSSVAAKIRHRVELMGRPLIGTGMYLQQGRGEARAFRMELQIRTNLFATHVRHVCDGNDLWIAEEFDGHSKVSRIDVARLRSARPKSRGPTTAPPPSWLLLGGLSKLLSNLQENFSFNAVVESRLDDLHVWSIGGTWEPAKLANLLPNQKDAIESGQAADLTQLAANLPHRVVLHVGSDDLFPYRIEYWRSDRADDSAAASERLIVVMELFEVQLGKPLDPAQFVYRPEKDVAPNDRTKEFLERLGLEDPPPEEAKRQLRSPL